jgi:hypothetical protein
MKTYPVDNQRVSTSSLNNALAALKKVGTGVVGSTLVA